MIPVPTVGRRRRQAVVASQAPRRSRRVAKLPPEADNQAAASICRKLGFTEDTTKVSKKTKEKYIAFFEKPLSRNHVVALASLLGKEVPEDTQAANSNSVVEVVA